MNTETQRGSILIYSMLAMAAMLAIGLTLSSLFLGKLRVSAAARDSVVALAAADSAVEKCLYEARQNTDVSPMTFSNGATYAVVKLPDGITDLKDKCSTLGAETFQFRATGEFRGIRRSLEISQ